MPRPRKTEKAKDFKGSIKRIFSEFKPFKFMIIISLILAVASAILSISAPNRLSSLTDEITNGIKLNTDNLKSLTESITNNLTTNISEKSAYIMQDRDISLEDKAAFMNALSNMNSQDINVILSLPNSIKDVLFEDITIDNTLITKEDQYAFLEKFANVDLNNSSTQDIYSKVDELPQSIKAVIEPKMNMTRIKQITLFLVVIYAISAIFSFVQSVIMAIVSNKFAKNLRTRISHKINKLPLNFFDKHSIGDILSRITNDVDSISQTMNESLATLVSSTTLFIGTIIMMFYTNWILALTAILSSLIGFIFMFIIMGKSQKYFDARQTELGKLNGHIEEVYSGLNIVKVYNGKKESDAKFDILNKNVFSANLKSQFLAGLMMPIMNFIGNFGYVAVCIVGALLAQKSIITFGVIVAFITYVRMFTSPLSQIAQAMNSLQLAAAAGERVFEFIDEKEMADESNLKNRLDAKDVKGRVEFQDVVFQYDDNPKPTIKDFSALALPGQKIAIVGPTGAGKTTLVNLLMKFYDINSGDIKIDGVSIKSITRQNVHALFTMVLQDTWLFDGSVRDNIKFNNENVTDEQILKIIDEVGLTHFIKTLPDGLDSKIGDNGMVSQGQKQLLTIARGMTVNTPFLILDEATSNVDTRTEELVQKAMDIVAKDKTSFIIAHRLSTIRNADLILVVNDGNIVEQGTHDELLKKNGFYAKLYNSQFEKIRES